MNYLPAIFSLIVAAAGWFYIFYSKAASNLSTIEATETNRLRVRLRRVGGSVMILLAVSFYLGFVSLERHSAIGVVGFMSAVLVFMMVIVVLGLFDLRLTKKLRDQTMHRQDPP